MSIMAAIAGLIFGLIVGGLLKLLADRLPTGGRDLLSPATCAACDARLDLVERLPVISYIRQRGRCGHCGAAIPTGHLLVELAAGAGSSALTLWLFPQPTLYVLLLLLYVGIVATAIDLEHRIIPNRLLLAGAAAVALVELLSGPALLLSGVEGGALLFVLALVLAIAGRGGFGFGDVKYLALVGFALGPVIGLVALFTAVLLGGLYAASLLARRRAGRRDTIAFGPFIAAASLLAPVLAVQFLIVHPAL